MTGSETEPGGRPERQPLRVLFVEDSPDDLELVVRELRRGGYDPQWRRVQTADQLLAALAEGGWEVALVDFRLPHFDAPAAIEILHREDPELPAIVVSGTVGEAIAVETLKAGAADFVRKDELTRLVPAVRRELRDAQAKRAGKAAEQARREGEERLREAADSLPETFVIYDRERRFRFVNRHGRELAGLEMEDLLGKRDEDVHPAPVAAAYVPLLERAVATREQQSGEADVEVGGRAATLSFTFTPLLDEDGEIREILSLTHDLSDRVAAERALREGRERYQGLFENSPVALWEEDWSAVKAYIDELLASGVTDLSAYLDEHPEVPATCSALIRDRGVNQAARTMYGVSGASGVDQDRSAWEQIMTSSSYELIARQMVCIAEGGTLVRGEDECRSLDGRPLSLLVTWQVAPGHERTYDLVYICDLDVSDLTRTAHALAQSEADLIMRQHIADVLLRSSEEHVYADVLDVVLESMDCPLGFLGYIDDDDGALVCPSLSNVWDRCAMAGKSVRFPRESWGETVWGESLRESRTVICNEPLAVPDGHLPMERVLAVPILHEGVALGQLTVGNKASAFDDDDAGRLEGIAAYLAPVLRVRREQAREEAARRAAEQALRGSEERYRTLFDQSPIGVLAFDAEMRVVDANRRLAKMMKVTQKQLVGLDLHQLKVPKVMSALERVLKGKSARYDGPYTSILADVELSISLRATPLYDSGGAVVGGVAMVADTSERQRFMSAIDKLSYEDAVTGLPNRALFNDRLRHALAHAERDGTKLAVAVVDVDRFAQVNDLLGRAGGDRLLRSIGRRLTKAVREVDTVARAGADEFNVLLPNLAAVEDVVTVAEKVVAAFAKPWRVLGHRLMLHASVGVAVYPGDVGDAEGLLRCADAALHRAKETGGDRWRLFDESLSDRAAERLQMETRLHRALEKDELVIHFQPQVRCEDGRVVGVEALVRWLDPDRGLLLPLEFIPLAEETGLIVPMGEHILRSACLQLREWHEGGAPKVRLAVNLSARQFREEGLSDMVRAALEETGLDASYLELEITESVAMDDVEFTVRTLGRLREIGVGSALDDFGTGFSSLSHLSTLPVDTLKIDRSFVSGIGARDSRATIVRSVIALGHELGLSVLAEGVETEVEADFLREHGCDEMQGFLYSRPLSAGKLAAILDAGYLKG